MTTKREARRARRDTINGAAYGRPLSESLVPATVTMSSDSACNCGWCPDGACAITAPSHELDDTSLLANLFTMVDKQLEKGMQEVPPIREQILVEAAEAVMGDRDVSYGGPEDSFTRIAELWQAHFGYHFDAGMVAQSLILLKLARVAQNPGHRDSWVDLCGYSACGAEVSGAVAA